MLISELGHRTAEDARTARGEPAQARQPHGAQAAAWPLVLPGALAAAGLVTGWAGWLSREDLVVVLLLAGLAVGLSVGGRKM